MEATAEHPDSHIRRFIAARRVDDPRYSITAFAKDCACARSLIYRVLAGDPEVGKDTFERIEEATGIKAEDLYGDWLAAKRAAASSETQPARA